MNNQEEMQAFDEWHYQKYCEGNLFFLSLKVEVKQLIYREVFSNGIDAINKENELKAWKAACRYSESLVHAKAEADQAEAKKAALSNEVLVDLEELEECYRMAVNHIRDTAVDLDEESALLMSICRIKGAITSHKRNMSDINEYLKRYSDGDVLIVSDRDKFSANCPSGVKAHFINHKSMWNSSDLMPFLNTVKFIHEIFIDRAFIAEVGQDSADNYIGFLIKEFKCSATVKRSKVTLDGGIFVEVDHVE